MKTSTDTRKLRDLAGIGKSIEANLISLGVTSVAALASRDGEDLYDQLCTKTRTRQDPCVLDTFRCAVAQARNPRLPRRNAIGGGGLASASYKKSNLTAPSAAEIRVGPAAVTAPISNSTIRFASRSAAISTFRKFDVNAIPRCSNVTAERFAPSCASEIPNSSDPKSLAASASAHASPPSPPHRRASPHLFQVSPNK